MAAYRTLAAPARFEPAATRGSRFPTLAAPVSTEAEALALVEAARAAHPDARHHCWAFRLRQDGRTRVSDDGEPGGSAGRPILARIEGQGLHDVAVVVSRYFGGVKLGVGGLIRAYSGAAGQALDRAEVIEVPDTAPLTLIHGYEDSGAVEALLGTEGLTPTEASFEEEVRRVLQVPAADLERLKDALRTATRGRARFE